MRHETAPEMREWNGRISTTMMKHFVLSDTSLTMKTKLKPKHVKKKELGGKDRTNSLASIQLRRQTLTMSFNKSTVPRIPNY